MCNWINRKVLRGILVVSKEIVIVLQWRKKLSDQPMGWREQKKKNYPLFGFACAYLPALVFFFV